MSVVGPTICSSGADGGGGAIAWTNPGNITANDSVFATSALATGVTPTNELKATGFGFSIPAGSSITQIQVDVGRLKT